MEHSAQQDKREILLQFQIRWTQWKEKIKKLGAQKGVKWAREKLRRKLGGAWVEGNVHEIFRFVRCKCREKKKC